jgi:hypothetical protein
MRRLGLMAAIAASACAVAAHAAEASKASDMECAARYLTLAAGSAASPQVQQTFMDRARAAGDRHATANPTLDRDQLAAAIQDQARSRSAKIVSRSDLTDLFIDIRLCDSVYGYPLTPFPPQPK